MNCVCSPTFRGCPRDLASPPFCAALLRCDKEVGCIEQAHDSLIWSMSWHPLGHVLASGSNDHTTKFWTRNRPGDSMQDKYNLNIGDGADTGPLPGGRRTSTSEDASQAGGPTRRACRYSARLLPVGGV